MKKIILILAVFSSLSWGTQTLANSTYVPGGAVGCNSSSGTTCTVTIPSTTAGNLVVAEIAMNGIGTTITAMHSGQAGTWVLPANCGGASAGSSVCWAYCLSAPAGMTSVAVDISVNNSARAAFVWEVSNGLTWQLHNAASAVRNASSASPTGVAFTSMSGLNCAAFQAIFTDTGATTSAIGSSYTLDGTNSRSGAHLLNTTTATAPTWTISTANASNVTGIAFKDGAAASTGARHRIIGGF